jgi:antitoxin VapB
LPVEKWARPTEDEHLVSLNIKDPEAQRLAQAISRATGESMTSVVKEALREQYARIERRKGKATVEELLAIADRPLLM